MEGGKAGIYGRRGAVLCDPLEHVLNRATIFDPLAVAGDGCRRMKSWAHKISVTRASARDVAVHGSGYGVMFDKVSVGGRLERGKALGFVNRHLARALGSQTAPSLNFMLV